MSETSELSASAASGNGESEERDVWMALGASFGPVLKAAFPKEHSLTRMQAADAICDEIRKRIHWLQALTTRLAPDRTDHAFLRKDLEAHIGREGSMSSYMIRAGLLRDILAALTPATAPDREAIARIIDPEAFSDFAAKCEDGMIWTGWPMRRDFALTKADAILSLMGEV